MKLADHYKGVEVLCPHFFDGMERVVLGEDIDRVADDQVARIRSVVAAEALASLVIGFQVQLDRQDPEDYEWLKSRHSPFLMDLAKKTEIVRGRRTGAGFLPQMVLEAVEVQLRLAAYAVACKALLMTLKSRAHFVEEHWDDYPNA